MKKRFTQVISLFLAVLLLMSSGAFSAAAGPADPIERKLKAMTTEEKITQMLIIAPRYFDGRNVTQLNEPLQKLFERYAFGGAILFAQNAVNAEQIVRLTDSLQKANAKAERPQLLISIDQEGGSVSRLATGTQLTGNMALGAIGKRSAARRSGEIIGEELAALGINVDFAPVLDVNNNPANPVIGIRSFSDDPAVVARLGTSFIEGLHSRRIMTSLKHFPGHGDTSTNSHTGLPMIAKTYQELQQNELIPFEAGIKAGAEMIMTAHIQYPNIDSTTYRSKATGEDIYLPATLSEAIMTGVLRRDMGYNGIIVTDAMNMDAIDKHFDRLDAVKLAIKAGVDMLLMPSAPYSLAGIEDLEQLIADVTALTDSGAIPMENVNDSVRRILKLKSKHGLLKTYETGDLDARIRTAVATVGSQAHHDEEFELAKRSITLTKNEQDLLPLREKNKKVLILTAYANELLSVEYGRNLAQERSLIPEGTEVTIGCYGNTPVQTIAAQIAQADVVIAISELSNAAGLDPAQPAGARAAGIDQMIGLAHRCGAKFIVLSARLPYDSVRFPDADAVMLCWSDKGMSEDPREFERDVPQYGPCIPAAVYMMFANGESITGRLPVDVPAITEDYQFADEIALQRGFGLNYKDYCPACGQAFEQNLWGQVRELIHSLIHVLQNVAAVIRSAGADLFDRLLRLF